MNRTATCLAGLLLVGAMLLPSAFAHSDSGAHAPPFFSTGLDVFDAEDGNGPPCVPPEDENVCYYGDNDDGRLNYPPASNGPSGWYYGSLSAWAEVQAGPDIPVLPPDPSRPVFPGGLTITPGFLFAAAFALCDAEILSAGTGPGATEDEVWVDGVDYTLAGNSQPDGNFNDGGIGAACHTPSTHYSYQPYNTPGCPNANAIALDAVSGEDIWISTSCDWITPAVEAGLLDHLLSLTTCVVNTVLTADVPGGTVTCVNTFVACAVTGLGCPSPGASFCGADGGSDAGESGQGDAGNTGVNGVANGVPYPTGPFTDSEGNVCTDISAATFVWNAGIVDVAGDNTDPDVESLSAATYGWISTVGVEPIPPCDGRPIFAIPGGTVRCVLVCPGSTSFIYAEKTAGPGGITTTNTCVPHSVTDNVAGNGPATAGPVGKTQKVGQCIVTAGVGTTGFGGCFDP